MLNSLTLSRMSDISSKVGPRHAQKHEYQCLAAGTGTAQSVGFLNSQQPRMQVNVCRFFVFIKNKSN